MPKPHVSTTWSGRPLRLLIALSAATFSISSCSPDTEQRLNEAAGKIGAARAEDSPAPALPQDCRDHTYIRPAEGERLDDLALRYAWALADEHARTDRCAAWYDANHGRPR